MDELRDLAERSVTIPTDVEQQILELLESLDGGAATDRRLVAAAAALRVAAFTSGRSEVTQEDGLLLAYSTFQFIQQRFAFFCGVSLNGR